MNDGYVPIPKDLKKVKTKVAFNLTRRQLIGFTLAGFVGIPVYLFMRKFMPNDIAILFLIISTLPIFFVTLFEKDGLTFEKYFKYIDKVDGYVTQQGSKGLEYNNVMVIINDDEKRGNQFSFEKLFGIDELSDTDINNIRNNKDNAVSRTRRLFYVTASRAKESLALIIYTRDMNKAKRFFIENSLATEEEIDMEV